MLSQGMTPEEIGKALLEEDDDRVTDRVDRELLKLLRELEKLLPPERRASASSTTMGKETTVTMAATPSIKANCLSVFIGRNLLVSAKISAGHGFP